jgi:hypothetical protein
VSLRIVRLAIVLVLPFFLACGRTPASAGKISATESAPREELDAGAQREIEEARARGIFFSTTEPPQRREAGATSSYGTVQR